MNDHSPDTVSAYHQGAIDMQDALSALFRATPPGARALPHAATFRGASVKPSVFIHCPLATALAHFDESPTIIDGDPVTLTWAHPVGSFVGTWTRDELVAAGLGGGA